MAPTAVVENLVQELADRDVTLAALKYTQDQLTIWKDPAAAIVSRGIENRLLVLGYMADMTSSHGDRLELAAVPEIGAPDFTENGDEYHQDYCCLCNGAAVFDSVYIRVANGYPGDFLYIYAGEDVDGHYEPVIRTTLALAGIPFTIDEDDDIGTAYVPKEHLEAVVSAITLAGMDVIIGNP